MDFSAVEMVRLVACQNPAIFQLLISNEYSTAEPLKLLDPKLNPISHKSIHNKKSQPPPPNGWKGTGLRSEIIRDFLREMFQDCLCFSDLGLYIDNLHDQFAYSLLACRSEVSLHILPCLITQDAS